MRDALEFVECLAQCLSKRPRQGIKTRGQIKFKKLLKQPITSMPSSHPYPRQRQTRITLGVCVLILWGMLFGTLASSMGGVMSHGLAEFVATHHPIDEMSVDGHGHSHDDEDNGPTFSETGADHPHHSADHTHDKSHVPSSAMTVAVAMASSWPVTARAWVELVEAFRLERPPMA